jgi:hypothetical protein
MNAMVNSITDEVESAIHRGHTSGGLRRYMLRASFAVLFGISPTIASLLVASTWCAQRVATAIVRLHTYFLPLSFAPGVYPMVRRLGPSPATLPPPPATGHGGPVAARRTTPAISTHGTSMDPWKPSFAYDFDIVFPPPPPLGHPSYTAVTVIDHIRSTSRTRARSAPASFPPRCSGGGRP